MPVPLSKDLVKTWFVSRAKPFWYQFAAWIDACWFKGEKIPVADIEGIDDYLGQVIPPVIRDFDVDYQYTIPAGFSIWQMYLNSYNADATIRIGTAAGLDDIIADANFQTGRITPITTLIPAQEAKDIFISGVVSATNLRIYLHKI